VFLTDNDLCRFLLQQVHEGAFLLDPLVEFLDIRHPGNDGYQLVYCLILVYIDRVVNDGQRFVDKLVPGLDVLFDNIVRVLPFDVLLF
jgi:hypothetical protein